MINSNTLHNITRGLAVLSLFIFSSVQLWALNPPAGDPPCGGPFGPCVPIDGGASLLLALGVAFGGKKAYDAFKLKQK